MEDIQDGCMGIGRLRLGDYFAFLLLYSSVILVVYVLFVGPYGYLSYGIHLVHEAI